MITTLERRPNPFVPRACSIRSKDEVRLINGTVKDHYSSDTLGIKYYQPLDKTRFPLPPSGWYALVVPITRGQPRTK